VVLAFRYELTPEIFEMTLPDFVVGPLLGILQGSLARCNQGHVQGAG